MATTGQIPSNISLGASQSVRRNSADTGFEAFTPGSGGTGDVTGPASAVSGNLASFNGTTGKAIQDSGSTAADFATSGHTHAAGFVPVGGIIMWSGNGASIPTNWAFCDGSNSTPDLRDRFIVGAKQDDAGVAKTSVTGALTQSGGSINYTPAGTNSTPTFAGTALGNHQHGVTGVAVGAHASHNHNVPASGTGTVKVGTAASNAALASHTHTTDGPGSTLTHSISGNADNASAGTPAGTVSAPTFAGTAATIVPPYYALAFIMRIA